MKSSAQFSWTLLVVLAACESTPNAPRSDAVAADAPPAPQATSPSLPAPSATLPIEAPSTRHDPQTASRAVERLTWAQTQEPSSSQPSPNPREPSWAEVEQRARDAFAALSPAQRVEVCESFALEANQLDGFQQALMRYVLASQEIDAGTWPSYSQPEWFDPALHAPAQPIARTLRDPSSADVLAVRRRILGSVAPRRLKSAWLYDYATRELRRLPDEPDPQRIFENGLIGAPPQWDLVEALVERALDDGSLRASFEAFGHAYTDRTGGVYPALTLYDAWASRTPLEMPDVDCLGIVHHVLNDWDTWKSVVPEDQHASLYSKIRELFQAAQHHRSLRHNIARTFVCGTTELRDGYQHNLDRFHALWESASSAPTQLATRLPKPDQWAEFLQGWSDELEADVARFLRGVNRRYTLDGDAQRVRQTLLRVLDEYGAFERLDASATGERGG